jgi:putative transposase
MAYLWRKLTPEKRAAIFEYRKRLRRPWHRPPHYNQGNIHYHLTGSCFEHQPFIGHTPDRMAEFCGLLIESFQEPPVAWCALPNHYHVLVRCVDIKSTIRDLGRLHGSTSFRWNNEENLRGRKIWHSVSDRGMRNADHFWATVNYIHHNPVKHGYVEQWLDWPFSSAGDYLEEVGREMAVDIWKRYPLLDYGKGWDNWD